MKNTMLFEQLSHKSLFDKGMFSVGKDFLHEGNLTLSYIHFNEI